MEQQWKKAVGTEYWVSTEGQVFSSYSQKILKQIDDGHGYPAVSIFRDTVAAKVKVHRLVAETFLPNPEGYGDVNHKDGRKTNNRVDNLEWCSRSQNIQHALDTGLMPRGSACGIAELGESEVEQIKLMFVEGLGNAEIAAACNVARGTISKIRQLKTWRHVRPDLQFSPTCPGGNTKKLGAEDIPKIRQAHKEGHTLSYIGKLFGVHSGTISGIISGRSWVNY